MPEPCARRSRWRPARRRRARAAGAFTLIELLVVIAIIVILLGLLGVALARALRTARGAATVNLLRSVSAAIEQFHTDFGYYPPLLSDDAAKMTGPERLTVVDDDRVAPAGQTDPQQARDELIDARFNSVFSLSVYLVGIGDITGSNVSQTGERADEETNNDDGVAGPGLRNPGADHSWGGAFNRVQHRAPVMGRVYGPYLDIGSGKNVRLITNEPAPRGANQLPDPPEDKGLYLIVDRWGMPIRYYKGWPTRDPAAPDDPSAERLPIEIVSATDIPSGAFLSPSSQTRLMRAPYALVSAGPDRLFFDNGQIDANNDGKPDDPWGMPKQGPFAERIDDSFKNSVELDKIKTANGLDALAVSLEDNVVITP